MYRRALSGQLPGRSFFLFGPRQVGKSTLLAELGAQLTLDLLARSERLKYSRNPSHLAEQVEALPGDATVLIDEVQRVPDLLDVVQALMGRFPRMRFVLSGSSARKLRRGHANLLGGRCLYRTLHPLTRDEWDKAFRLDRALAFGSLPHVATAVDAGDLAGAADLLRSYVVTYLDEEVRAEALVRNLGSFQGFLEVAAAQFCEQVNYTEVGRETDVAYATVREYYAILEDTLIGFRLEPWMGSRRKRMSLAPKFCFFDNGLTRALLGTLRDPPTPAERGRLFEQWVVQEARRENAYRGLDWRLSFWRTSHGAEVDLVVERGRKLLFAVECKSTPRVSASDLSGLRAFAADHPRVPLYVCAPVRSPFRIERVTVLPPERIFGALAGL